MSHGKFRAVGPLTRLLACIAVIGMVAGPSAALVDHALAHQRAVHEEASHPNAAPHLDREVHLDRDRCVGCLATFPAGEVVDRFVRSGVAETTAASPPILKPLVSRARLRSSPRAPPA